jgi:hypothetical protein
MIKTLKDVDEEANKLYCDLVGILKDETESLGDASFGEDVYNQVFRLFQFAPHQKGA